MNIRWGVNPNEKKCGREDGTRCAIFDDNKPVYPIMERIRKGVTGYDSIYKLTPACTVVIRETAKANEQILAPFLSHYTASSTGPAALAAPPRDRPTGAKPIPANQPRTCKALKIIKTMLSLVDTDLETVDSLIHDVEDLARSGGL